MAELIAHTPQHAILETSGYIGEPTGEIILTENHRTYNVKEYAEATTNIPDPILIDKKFEANGTYSAQDYEADGFSEVEVDVQPFLMTKNISKNGNYKASEDGAYGYDEVKVNLPFEQKTVTPSTTQQTVTPSEGYEALESVTVEATPLESVMVTPTTEQQTLTPTAPNIGFDRVTVEAYIPPAPVQNPVLTLIDWEGTVLKEYSKEDALALTELPLPNSLPIYADVDHEYLVFQEWNWSLTDIKNFVQNRYNENLLVQAVYTTSDNTNHLYWDNPRLEGQNKRAYKWKSKGNLLTNYAFDTCYSLNSVSIPNGITSTGIGFCNACYALKSIVLPNGITNIGATALNNCFSLTFISLPNSVSNIDANAFRSCQSLSSIIIPNGVTSIGVGAFRSCNSLLSLIIPNGVTSVGDYGIYECYALNRLDIPSSVTNVGTAAFKGNGALCTIVVRGKTEIPSIDVFSGRNSAALFYVPRANISWFESATNWSAIYSENKIVTIEDNIEYLESVGINVDEYKVA